MHLRRPLHRLSTGSVLELDEAALARLALLRSSTTTSQSQFSTACATNVTGSHIQGLLDAGNGSTPAGGLSAGNALQLGAAASAPHVHDSTAAVIGLDMLTKALMSQNDAASTVAEAVHPYSPAAGRFPTHASADHALMAPGKGRGKEGSRSVPSYYLRKLLLYRSCSNSRWFLCRMLMSG
jgi:hypothetical protein